MGGRAIVRNSKQRAKSTEGIVDHDENLGNAVEKTEGQGFGGAGLRVTAKLMTKDGSTPA